MASPTSATDSDGPVQTLISKKIRALKKKLTRITQLEESQSSGKTLNKEQSDLLKSKAQVTTLIDEYEKLRQPLQVAVQEEIAEKGSILEDLVKVLYFGRLFDVKSQNEFANVMLTRLHERECCLTYDYVTDEEDRVLLADRDLELIGKAGSLIISKGVHEKVSHKDAVDECVRKAKLWVDKSEEIIAPDVDVTYAGLREKLNRIMSLDYFTMTPEMKAPVDVAVAVYNSIASTCAETGNVQTQDDAQTNGHTDLSQNEEAEQEEFQQVETDNDQSTPNESENRYETIEKIPSEDNNAEENEQARVDDTEHNNQRDFEHKEQQQHIPRRGYQNQRGGGRGGGGPRRGYSNARGGGRRGRGGDGGVYQNGGRGQYHNDFGYHPRQYYNTRGRGGGGGRGGSSAMHSGSSNGDHVEPRASS